MRWRISGREALQGGATAKLGELGVGDLAPQQPRAYLARLLRLPREGRSGVRHQSLRAKLNFPDTPPPLVPNTTRPLTYAQIQAIATRHAASNPSPGLLGGSTPQPRAPPQRKRRLAKTSTFTLPPPSAICRIRS
ncbi:hypothetical protein Cni_G17047 [Canna indica]|uniref:Uncharacterized protein n=1 Tax=Canna indica TaxID=4628 RepID=A0AAQ3QER2_9LILI|nr:hypothetical protein Cni_G17047 [Canna indica]